MTVVSQLCDGDVLYSVVHGKIGIEEKDRERNREWRIRRLPLADGACIPGTEKDESSSDNQISLKGR